MDSGKVFEKVVHLAVQYEITMKFAPLRASYARINGVMILLGEWKPVVMI